MLGEGLLDNFGGLRQVIEWDLWEEMVLSLELHSSEQHQPEEALLVVVSGSFNLVSNKVHVDLSFKDSLSFVVSDKDYGSDVASDKISEKDDPE